MKKLIVVVFLFVYLKGAGQQVANFTLVNAMNGESVSLSNYSSTGLAIIFTSNNCPYDDYYLNRIKKITQQYAGKNISVILVNSIPGESVADMRKRGEQCALSVPYLADKDQVLMQSLGASKSPEAFLLKNSGDKFSVVYRGAIDDNAQVESDVHQPYLKNAIDALLAGKSTESSEVRPVGCTIRKK